MDFLLGTKILERKNSKFNGEIKVIRNLAFGTYIQVGGITQSGGIVESIWRKTLGKIKNTTINNCLILGLGGGSVVKVIKKYWPKAEITGVDIDPEIIEMGKKYLKLAPIKIVISDAEKYIINSKDKFDLILIDLYQGKEFPSKFESPVFSKLILSRLLDNGVSVFNRLYFGEERLRTVKFGEKLEKVFPKVERFFPEANLMFLCYNKE